MKFIIRYIILTVRPARCAPKAFSRVLWLVHLVWCTTLLFLHRVIELLMNYVLSNGMQTTENHHDVPSTARWVPSSVPFRVCSIWVSLMVKGGSGLYPVCVHFQCTELYWVLKNVEKSPKKCLYPRPYTPTPSPSLTSPVSGSRIGLS